MLRYMLDTNICIHILNERSAHLLERFNQAAEELSISTIVLAELHFGAEKSSRSLKNLHGIENFAARLAVLPFSAKAAAHYGQIRADLQKAGTPIGLQDTLIAAHARAEALVVVTNDRREFDRVPGLQVEDWL